MTKGILITSAKRIKTNTIWGKIRVAVIARTLIKDYKISKGVISTKLSINVRTLSDWIDAADALDMLGGKLPDAPSITKLKQIKFLRLAEYSNDLADVVRVGYVTGDKIKCIFGKA